MPNKYHVRTAEEAKAAQIAATDDDDLDPEPVRPTSGARAEIGLPREGYFETCPVRAFEAWQAVARRKAGPLFRKISTGDGIGEAALPN